MQIDQIKELVEHLAALPPGSSETQALADRIRDGLDTLKRHLGG
jgi:hypothetical protein